MNTMSNLLFSVDDTAAMKELMTTIEDGTEHMYLEKEHGFLLCLHLRNFIAGTSIITNITNAILGSRRVILILSRFVLSRCHCCSTQGGRFLCFMN